MIEQEFGDFPIKALAARETRGVFMDWRDKLALKSPRQADYAWTVLARILSGQKIAVDHRQSVRAGRPAL